VIETCGTRIVIKKMRQAIAAIPEWTTRFVVWKKVGQAHGRMADGAVSP
jgi:hypothetical protein